MPPASSTLSLEPTPAVGSRLPYTPHLRHLLNTTFTADLTVWLTAAVLQQYRHIVAELLYCYTVIVAQLSVH